MAGNDPDAGIPSQVREAGLSEWYTGLSDSDRVKTRRYASKTDASSQSAFMLTLLKAASDDENHRFVLSAAQSLAGSGVDLDVFEYYGVNEIIIPSLFEIENYDVCLAHCEEGLSLLDRDDVREKILSDNGGIFPENVNCRNYKINVVVGVKGDYKEGDAILDEYVAKGLISEDEAACRKRSQKIRSLESKFDGIFSSRRRISREFLERCPRLALRMGARALSQIPQREGPLS